jgi:type 1 glutamine amidotransferase
LDILATAYETVGNASEGRDEPVMWTVPYGKGRVFVTVLGHAGNDPELRYSMECAGFQVTLLRGSEWAARGVVTQKVPKDFPSKGVFTLRKDFKAPFHAY